MKIIFVFFVAFTAALARTTATIQLIQTSLTRAIFIVPLLASGHASNFIPMPRRSHLRMRLLQHAVDHMVGIIRNKSIMAVIAVLYKIRVCYRMLIIY